MRFNHFSAFFLILGLSACSEAPQVPELTFSTDFESEAGWLNDDRLKKSDDAHSGRWYAASGEFLPFTPSFKMKARAISRRPLRRVEFIGWVRSGTVPSRAQLVLSAEADTTSIYYAAKPLEGFLKEAGKWTEIKTVFEIPNGSFGPDNTVNIYIWSPDRTVVGLDDVTLRFSN
ncbi:MAG: hypothetical protein RL021_829 [Bacteroidota bacterium]|jgi:hypothetical protein